MNLSNVFIEFDDIKNNRGKKHKISDILIMAIYGFYVDLQILLV